MLLATCLPFVDQDSSGLVLFGYLSLLELRISLQLD
jgi:hypothetical protein